MKEPVEETMEGRCKGSIRMYVGAVMWVMQGGWVCYSTERSYLVSLALLRALGWAESLPTGAGRLPATLPWLRASQGTLRVLWQEEKLQGTVKKMNVWSWKFVLETKYWSAYNYAWFQKFFNYMKIFIWNSSGSQKIVAANVYNNNNPRNKNLLIFRILLDSAKAKWFLKKKSIADFLTIIIFLENRALCVKLCMVTFISTFFKTISAIILMSTLSKAGEKIHCFKLIHSRLVMMQKCHHISKCYIFMFHVNSRKHCHRNFSRHSKCGRK